MAEKVLYYSRSNRRNRTYAPTGDGTEPKMEMKIDEFGHKELVQVGTTNLYDKIQLSADDCNIEDILARAGQGDLTAFTGSKIYADVTDAPKNLADAQRKIQAIQNEFNSLPIEVRAKYNHSVSEYVAAYGTKEWAKNLGLIEEPKKNEPEPKKPETKEGGEVNE